MKKIVLLCAAGMSTSLLVTKMRDVAKNEGLECTINAYSLGEEHHVIPDADIVLLGPQVRYSVKKLQQAYPNKIIESIEMRAYGMMDGAAVMKFVKEKITF
ncbi:MAG: PTS sugar transporter subunit IIB [Erysipelotrichaceae bacterium]|nr:PTS sugar transporter subunit IIB [Erysipelotrichaceae bacterium]